MPTRLISLPDWAPAAGCGAAAAGFFATLQEWVTHLLGVSIGVPVAAFAGTFYGLSFRAPMKPWVLWVNLVAGSVLASVLAPLTGHLFSLPLPAQAGAAAVLGFLLQYAQPWLLDRRTRLLDSAADRALGQKEKP